MPRVHEVAKELGVSSRQVLDHLEAIGAPVSSHSSSVDEATAERLRSVFGDGPAATTGTDFLAEDAAAPALEEGAEESGPKKVKSRKGFLRHLAEVPVLILFAFAIAIVIKTLFVQAFYIPSGSMIPTLRVGDRVLVEKISYRFGGPQRGDVVVFARSVFGTPPDLPWHQDVRNFVRELLGMQVAGGEEDYIKRVVAVGGDSIRYEGTPRQLFVNGEEVEEPYIRFARDRTSSTITSSDCNRLEMQPADGGCAVPAGMVFVMGDNRPNSQDSRSIGPVSEDKIVGRAFVIIWPPGDVGGL